MSFFIFFVPLCCFSVKSRRRLQGAAMSMTKAKRRFRTIGDLLFSMMLYDFRENMRWVGLAAMAAETESCAMLLAGCFLHVLTNLVIYTTWS